MRKRRVRFDKSRLWWAASTVVLLGSFASGCSSLDRWRGEGFKDSQNWSHSVREPTEPVGKGFIGLSTKANQIERNLGVR